LNAESGLDYILNHFESKFPRTISTLSTQHKQIEVYDKKETLQYFKESNYVDCRISAFGREEIEQEKPNLIFVDLDNKLALDEVLALFHKTINAIPLILNTGNGYAIIQPIQMIPLIKTKLGERQIFDVSKQFLLFAERYLTNSKCDMGNHPSLRSCLIRIPGSFNSKLLNQGKYQQAKVSVISEWNGIRADVRNLPFLNYLRIQQRRMKRQAGYISTKTKISYIENILQNKIIHGRKRIFALIICPYLVNVKKLSLEECERIITDYFDGYVPKNTITYKLNDVYKKGILPYSLKNMQNNDPELYQIVSNCTSEVL